MELLGIVELLDVIKLVFMNKYSFVLAVGLFLGWNLPQPERAKKLQDWVVALVTMLYNKIKNKNTDTNT